MSRRRAAAFVRRHVSVARAYVGWRFWGLSLVKNEFVLRSPFHDTIWPVGRELTAECHSARGAISRPGDVHRPPGDRCSCGVYGGTYRSVRTLLGAHLVPPAEAIVVGRTLLWGDVIESSSAWRAEFGYPDRLLVPAVVRDAHRIAQDLEAYQVPVLLLDAADTYAALQPAVFARHSW